MADSKISALTDGGGLQAGDELAIARSSTSFRATPIGMPVLIYRYTVTGSDKASIDTGVDTADAGSNDWTNGDLLEVCLVARTDEAAAISNLLLTFNNDGGANYDVVDVHTNNATVGGAQTSAGTSITVIVHGSGGSASYASGIEMFIPTYAGTTFYKTGRILHSALDATAGNVWILDRQFAWRSTSALTRLAVAAAGGQKLKVGSQLLIYKRLSS